MSLGGYQCRIIWGIDADGTGSWPPRKCWARRPLLRRILLPVQQSRVRDRQEVAFEYLFAPCKSQSVVKLPQTVTREASETSLRTGNACSKSMKSPDPCYANFRVLKDTLHAPSGAIELSWLQPSLALRDRPWWEARRHDTTRSRPNETRLRRVN